MSFKQLEDLDKDTLLFAAHRARLRAANMHTEVHKTHTNLITAPVEEAPEVAVSLAKKIGAYRALESLATTLQNMATHIPNTKESQHGE